ncbi:hypothetical protein BDAP_002893 [Binucleata daphniae]
MTIGEEIKILTSEVNTDFKKYIKDNMCDERTLELALSKAMKTHLAEILDNYKKINDFFTKNELFFKNIDIIIKDLICVEKEVILELVAHINEIKNEIQQLNAVGITIDTVNKKFFKAKIRHKTKDDKNQIKCHLLRIGKIINKINSKIKDFDGLFFFKFKNTVAISVNKTRHKSSTAECTFEHSTEVQNNTTNNNEATDTTENIHSHIANSHEDEKNNTDENDYDTNIDLQINSTENKNKESDNATSTDFVVIPSINHKNEKCFYTVTCSLHKKNVEKCTVHCLKHDYIICEEIGECGSGASKKITGFVCAVPLALYGALRSLGTYLLN